MNGQTLHVTGPGSGVTNLITVSGQTTLGNTAPTFDVQGANTLALAGPVSGSAGLIVGAAGASTGTLQLAGNNTSLTGGVTINSGTLQLGSPGALNSAAPMP